MVGFDYLVLEALPILTRRPSSPLTARLPETEKLALERPQRVDHY